MGLETEAKASLVAISIVAITSVIIVIVQTINWVWLRPKKLEKYLREQGFDGNSYRVLRGDMLEFGTMARDTISKHIKLSDNVSHHALPYIYHIIKKYGKKSFVWLGPAPSLQILDPDQIRDILSRNYIFQKVHTDPLSDIILGGLLTYEEQKWAKHRKIINPAFHLEKLKKMLPVIHLSCVEMIKKWEALTLKTGSAEIDVWPSLEDLSGDVISRTAFGSNYEEGRKIFLLQKEQVDLTLHIMQFVFIPGWRYLPTKASRRMREICKELQTLLKGIVSKRQIAMEMGEDKNEDLLGILLESNSNEIREDGIGMSIEEVMKECKLFYFAGSETTSNLLVWTLVLLSQHPEWQTRAREEVLHTFGNTTPDFDGLSHLKVVTMILQEVLRLYPPVTMLTRSIPKDTKLGNTKLLAGTQFIIPIILLHYDPEIWGTNAHEFRPERFSEGISSATKNKFAYIPFGGGPRTCIGQNFAMVEAKMALSMILQRFSFELSPSYKHAPFSIITLQPQSKTLIILHRL